jgi:glycosyltransferase involved in cell wall biosynthesis
MLKIIYAYNILGFQKPGGGETQLLETLRYVSKQGFIAHLFNPFLKLDSYDILHVFGLAHHLLDIAEYWKTNIGKPLVITPLWWSFEEYYAKTGKRILALRDKIYRHLRRMRCFYELQRYLDIRLDLRGLLLSRSDVIIATSNMERELLAKHFGIPLSKIRVVYNGVSRRFYEEADPTLFVKKYGIRDFVLCVAGIYPKKNQLALLRALEKEKEIPLVFIGPVADKRYYYKLLEISRKRGNVYFLGEIPHDSPILPSAYAAAKVCVLPSWFDAPGLVTLEAALAGCRVVVTNRGPMKEYFGDLALYIDPGDIGDIREKVLHAYYSDMDTSKLRKHVLENFTWDRVLAPLIDIYKELMQNVNEK